MDYLLNRYLFDYLPFEVAEETKKAWGQKAVNVVMWADWVCKYQDPWKIYENHTSFLFGELLFFLLCTLTFIHAYRNGVRYMTVWVAILIHALNVENLCYWIPDMDNFWQAQGILTFFGSRAPLYILLGIYHMFDYCSYVMISRLRLPWWAEGPAVGLGAVMLDMPYDIMGIKLVWWTWHDTDPNIYQRMYWVPWTSYYFHASFACSLVWLLRASRHYLVEETYDWKKEFLCSLIAGMGAFWLGVTQFGVFYHPLHDYFHVHTEIIVCLFLGFYALVFITADRNNRNPLARLGNKYWFDEISCAIALEYLFYMILVIVADPVNIVAEGLHQPIGSCEPEQEVRSFVKLLKKKKYLCLKNYDEKYFDFHCIPNGGAKGLHMPEDGSPLEWYAVCGTDFDNRAEYVTIIWGICLLYGYIFYLIAKSSKIPVYPVKQYRLRERGEPRMNQEKEKLLQSPGKAASPKAEKKTPGKLGIRNGGGDVLNKSMEEQDDQEVSEVPNVFSNRSITRSSPERPSSSARVRPHGEPDASKSPARPQGEQVPASSRRASEVRELMNMISNAMAEEQPQVPAASTQNLFKTPAPRGRPRKDRTIARSVSSSPAPPPSSARTRPHDFDRSVSSSPVPEGETPRRTLRQRQTVSYRF